MQAMITLYRFQCGVAMVYAPLRAVLFCLYYYRSAHNGTVYVTKAVCIFRREYCTGTARRPISLEILSIAEQLYKKSQFERLAVGEWT